MTNEFDHVPNHAWHALRSVAHFFVRRPGTVLGVLVTEAGYWILWPMLGGQPIDLPRPTAAAFVAFSSVGILTAIRLLRATLKGRADRRGNLKGSLSINAEVESAARDIDALNDYQERRYRGEE